MDQNIKVYVRCRPLAPNERHNIVQVEPENGDIKLLERNIAGLHHQAKIFHFDQVFSPEAKQEEVHNAVVTPLIKQVLLGFNCTVFAYGQTGSGKTYTMEGTGDDCGFIPRAISDLFDSMDNQFNISVSFLELYNEDTYDLLSDITDTSKLRIFNDEQKKGSVRVENLSDVPVRSKDQIYDILRTGSAKRQTAATLLNACSSRSHTIFTITTTNQATSASGKLNLVDLAGSENIGRSGAQDKRAREAGNINQSLLALGRVITALIEKRPHIPYRESKLTRLLQDSLGGSTKTSVIATISPSYEDAEATVGTLEYASRARNIKNRPTILRVTEFNPREFISYDKHSSEILDYEWKIRNEIAGEFKLASDAMKNLYEQEINAMKLQNEALYARLEARTAEKEALTTELKATKELNEEEINAMKLQNEALYARLEAQTAELKATKELNEDLKRELMEKKPRGKRTKLDNQDAKVKRKPDPEESAFSPIIKTRSRCRL